MLNHTVLRLTCAQALHDAQHDSLTVCFAPVRPTQMLKNTGYPFLVRHMYGAMIRVYACVLCSQVGVERLCAWLQHVKWTRPEMCGNLRHAATVTLRYPQDDPAMQRAQLQVLRAMQLDINPEIQGNISVTLEGWNLTHTAMDVLREGLPEWASQIDIRDCQFPLAPKAYKRLAQCVPLCYTTWHTEFLMGSKVWASVTKGLNARREGLGLPQVLVTVPEPDEPVFCPRKVYKHCVVEVRCEAEDSDWDEPE